MAVEGRLLRVGDHERGLGLDGEVANILELAVVTTWWSFRRRDQFARQSKRTEVVVAENMNIRPAS